MLNEMCKLIFNQKLLLEEYNFSFANDNNDNMPILSAFERMMSLGGTTKPHINATAVSRISAAWMCHDGFEADMGVCAIPYRTHIANLLFYKECKLDESTANQALSKDQWSGALPEATDDLSITRGFVLLFLSKLPSPEVMSNIVLKELIHFIIMYLLDNVCCAKVQPGDIFISGSVEYGRRSRAWQALCLLSRFVTDDIAEDVATRAYHAMSMNSHGQIRYFMEV